METAIGSLFGALTGIAILAALIAAFFMWIGAKMAGIKEATFGKSLIAAIGAEFIIWIFSLILSVIPVIGTVIGFIVGLTFAIFVIKGTYNTSFGKALVAWVFCVISEIVAIGIGVTTFAGALFQGFA